MVPAFWADQLSRIDINYVFVIWIIWFYDYAIKGEVCSIFFDVFVSLSGFPILCGILAFLWLMCVCGPKTGEMVKQAQ